MIVLDTHAWLWWETEPRRLSRPASRAIDRADRVGICTISVLELVSLVERKGVELDRPVRVWVNDAFARDRVSALPLTSSVAVDAGQLRFVGDPTDRIIYATTRAENAQLVTRDERLRRFDPDRTLW